jgi:ABC-type nitrate/sulfonate/bicarbonate transport system permease component
VTTAQQAIALAGMGLALIVGVFLGYLLGVLITLQQVARQAGQAEQPAARVPAPPTTQPGPWARNRSQM